MNRHPKRILVTGGAGFLGDLARKVVILCGSRSPIVHQRRPDIAMAEQALGWRPTVGLDAGLERTIAYFDTLLGERSPQFDADRLATPAHTEGMERKNR
jgi:nucleoside-diphosphate-sugar epimerase